MQGVTSFDQRCDDEHATVDVRPTVNPIAHDRKPCPAVLGISARELRKRKSGNAADNKQCPAEPNRDARPAFPATQPLTVVPTMNAAEPDARSHP